MKSLTGVNYELSPEDYLVDESFQASGMAKEMKPTAGLPMYLNRSVLHVL